MCQHAAFEPDLTFDIVTDPSGRLFSGEDVVKKAVGQPRGRLGARRVFSGKVLKRQVRGSQPASAVVQLPAGLSEQAGLVLVANITLNFHRESHQDYMVVLNGPDDASQVQAGSPFYLGTILMFGHHAHGGAMSYAIPLGDKLSQARAAADGSIQLRVVPLNATEHHHDSADASVVELLAVNVESY